MKKILCFLTLLVLIPFSALVQGDTTEEPEEEVKINISVPQGKVLPQQRRKDALTVARRLVDNSPTDRDPILEKLKNPFVFEVEEVEEVEVEEESEDGSMNPQAPRNDLEVLRLLAPPPSTRSARFANHG